MTAIAAKPTPPGALLRSRAGSAPERAPSLTDRLQARITANFPMPIRSPNWRGIKALWQPRDLETYAALLPRPLALPRQPLVLIEYAEVSPRWHEGIVSIACRFEDDEGWHGIYWAIDSTFPYAFGRLVGYPKFRADRMTFRRDGASAVGEVFHRGRHAFSVAFSPRDGEVAERDRELLQRIGMPAGELPYYLLVPAGRGPWLNRLTYTQVVSCPAQACEGRVTVHVDADEPWTRLFAGGEAEAPGKLLETSGTAFGWLTSRRVGSPR